MESKKLSRTVRKRLNKKARLQSAAANSSKETNLTAVLVNPAALSIKQFKQKKVVPTTQPKPVITSKPHRKHAPENKVIYINSNYGGDDPNSVGGRIQAELIGLRKESKNIKTASDLTESQAHVVKRQITRLQGAVKAKVSKRSKKVKHSLGEATNELMSMIKKEQQKLTNTSTKTKG